MRIIKCRKHGEKSHSEGGPHLFLAENVSIVGPYVERHVMNGRLGFVACINLLSRPWKQELFR